jgi:hypothetical protein
MDMQRFLLGGKALQEHSMRSLVVELSLFIPLVLAVTFMVWFLLNVSNQLRRR